MDKSPVWVDSVKSLAKKDIPMNLTTKGWRRKRKSFIVYASAKRVSKALHEEFKNQCCITSSGNGWISEELTSRWTAEVLGKFSFRKRLLQSGTHNEYHMAHSVKKRL